MWLDEDTWAALEWFEYEDSLCSGCGLPRHETFDSDSSERYEAEALICHACAERDRLMQKWRKDEDADPAGVTFVVREVD